MLKSQLQQPLLHILLLLFDCLGVPVWVGGGLAESETKIIPRFCNLCQIVGPAILQDRCILFLEANFAMCIDRPRFSVCREELPFSQARPFETARRRCPLMVQPKLPNWGPGVCPEFGEFDKIAVFNHFAFILMSAFLLHYCDSLFLFQKSPHNFICK